MAQQRLAESERRLSILRASLPGMACRRLNDEFWTMKFVSGGGFAPTGAHQIQQVLTSLGTNAWEAIGSIRPLLEPPAPPPRPWP